MDRRRSLLKIAALRTERGHQEGASTAEGGFTSDAPELREPPFTVQCVFVPRSVAAQQTIFVTNQSSSSPRIDILTNGNMVVYFGASANYIPVVIGRVYDIVFVCEQGRQSAYVDGELIATREYTFPETIAYYNIGFYVPSAMNRFDGDYLLHRHFNYALSAEEVAALHNDGDPAGYVLPGTYKGEGNSYESNFSTSSERWAPRGDAVLTYDEINHVVELNSGNNSNANMYSPVTYDTRKGHVYNIEVIIDKNTAVSRCQFFPYVSNESISLIAEDNDDITIFKGVYIPSDRYLFSNNLYCYFILSSPTTVRVRSIRVTPVGCVAEYLPQNLVGQRDDKPIEITGDNSFTWTGVDDSNYSRAVRVSRPFTIGKVYKIRLLVSDWEAGNAPFIKIGSTGSYYLPDFNGNGTYEIYAIPNGTPYAAVYIYAGQLGTDRRMTITVDSVEPIPDIALSWLDSAKQLPLNDEYLPPLLQSDGGYDLTANGMPEIIIK